MTNEEINKMIHTKVMGECSMPITDNDPSWEKFDEKDGICRECNRGIGDHTRIPKYTSDLNAVHRVEVKVDEELGMDYCIKLREVLRRDMPESRLLHEMDYALAEARQRAEAVLRATGNWEDE